MSLIKRQLEQENGVHGLESEIVMAQIGKNLKYTGNAEEDAQIDEMIEQRMAEQYLEDERLGQYDIS